MDELAQVLIDRSKEKTELIYKELEGDFPPSPEMIRNAIMGAVISGTRLMLEELGKRNKLK